MKRFYYCILACVLALLPSVTRAQQGYAELAINNGESWGSDDAQYTLTFYYGTKPTDTSTAQYFDTEGIDGTSHHSTNMPGWLGWHDALADDPGATSYTKVTDIRCFSYSPKITRAVFDSSFAAARPTSCYAWFLHCDSIAEIVDMEKYLNTENAISMARMFGFCRKLEYIDVSNFNTQNVTNFYQMFYYCNYLTAVPVENFNTANATNISNVFSGCTSLLSVNVSHWDTSNARSLAGLFNSCNALTTVDVSHFNTEKVTDMTSMFAGCRSLKELNLSSFNTSKITNFRAMFQSMHSLEVLDISNFDMTKAQIVFQMFYGDSYLRSIYVGDKWDLSNLPATFERSAGTDPITGQIIYVTTDAAGDMFHECRKLTGALGTKWNRNNPTGREYAIPDGQDGNPGYLTAMKPFAVFCPSNHTLYLLNANAGSDFATSYTPETGGAALTGNHVISSNLLMENTTTHAVWDLHQALLDADDNEVFYPNFSLTDIQNVVFEPTFASLRPTTFVNWFNGLTNLTGISGTANVNSSNANTTAQMFKDTKITKFDIEEWPYFRTDHVTNMSGMFDGCSELTAVNLDASRFNTAKVVLFQNMFRGCAKLQYGIFNSYIDNTPFSVARFNTARVTNMSGMFEGCALLAGEFDFNHFVVSSVRNMSNMFKDCSNITVLKLSTWDVSKVTDFSGMFSGASALTTIEVPFDWDISGKTGDGMFTGCSALEGALGTRYSAMASSDAANADGIKYAVIDEDAIPGYLTGTLPSELEIHADRENDLGAYNGLTIPTVYVYKTFTAGKCTTICLPFSMTAAQVSGKFGSGTQLFTLTGFNRSTSKLTYTAATEIKAGVPYVIKPVNAPTFTKGGKTYDGFIVNNRTIVADASTTSVSGLSLKGTFADQTVSVSGTATLKVLLPTHAGLGKDFSQTGYYATPDQNHVEGLSAYFVDLNISDYRITISDAGVSTLYLPYAVEIPDEDYFVPCTVNEVIADLGDEYTATALLRRIKGGIIPANTAVIINANPGTYTLSVTERDVTEDVGTNWLHGVTEDTPIAQLEYEDFENRIDEISAQYADEGEYAIFFAMRGVKTSLGFFYNTAYNYGTDYNEFDMSVYPDKWCLANKAYLKVSTSSGLANVKYINAAFIGEGGATDIKEVEPAAASEGVYYNLNGQRVNAPVKGIYIKDGKKVLVK